MANPPTTEATNPLRARSPCSDNKATANAFAAAESGDECVTISPEDGDSDPPSSSPERSNTEDDVDLALGDEKVGPAPPMIEAGADEGEKGPTSESISGDTSRGAVACAIGVVAKLRARNRQSHQRLARRIGVGLVPCSATHNITLAALRITKLGGTLCTMMTHVLSSASLLLHCWLALSYEDERLLWTDFICANGDVVIDGVFILLSTSLRWLPITLLCGVSCCVRSVHGGSASSFAPREVSKW